MALDSVNERSSWFTDVAFTDENGDPVVPNSASYQIHDVGSLEQIREATAISPTAETVRIMWEPSDTRILDQSHAHEVRVMTVSWIYTSTVSPGAEAEGHEKYYARVWNLRAIESPSPE